MISRTWVEAFCRALDASGRGGEDPGAVCGSSARGDELRDTATLSARTPPIEQLAGGGWVEVAGEHLPQGFFEEVGPPEYSARLFVSRSVSACVSVRSPGFFSNAHRAPLKPWRCPGRAVSERLPHLPAHLVERVGGEFDDMERVEANRRLWRVARIDWRRGAHVHRPRDRLGGTVVQSSKNESVSRGLARITTFVLARH